MKILLSFGNTVLDFILSLEKDKVAQFLLTIAGVMMIVITPIIMFVPSDGHGMPAWYAFVVTGTELIQMKEPWAYALGSFLILMFPGLFGAGVLSISIARDKTAWIDQKENVDRFNDETGLDQERARVMADTDKLLERLRP